MRNKSINGIALLIVLALLLCMPLPSVGQDDMTDDYITAWEAYVDAWRTGDITLLEDTVTDDFTRHTQWDPTTVGREELAVVIAGFREAMDGVTLHPVTEEDVLIRGDYMWMRAGMTPPGMDEMGYYVGMARFEDGLVAEAWLADDPLLLMEVMEMIELPMEPTQ